jgi:hypothetical protein
MILVERRPWVREMRTSDSPWMTPIGSFSFDRNSREAHHYGSDNYSISSDIVHSLASSPGSN